MSPNGVEMRRKKRGRKGDEEKKRKKERRKRGGGNPKRGKRGSLGRVWVWVERGDRGVKKRGSRKIK